MGDSKVIIDWVNGKSSLHSIFHQHWMIQVKRLIQSFEKMTIFHIYRIFNNEAYLLSKQAIKDMNGFLLFEESLRENLIDYGYYYVF